jgi:hypothetical protein
MSKARFSLRRLLGAVALVGATCAAIRCPTHACASLTLSIAFGVLVAAVVAAAICRGTMRAYWLSFAIVGWAHLFLSLTPWFAEGTSGIVFSRYCLDRLAGPLGHTIGWPAEAAHRPLKDAVEAYTPGSPPDRYSKYVVIGQSTITVWLAILGGVFGRFLYFRHSRTE